MTVPSSALQEVCLRCVVIDRGTRSSFSKELAGYTWEIVLRDKHNTILLL